MCSSRASSGFVVGLSLCALSSARALADYPVMSHRYLADPGSLVFNGRVYLYNSNDDDNAVGGGYTMHSVVCVSSADMKNWTDHGIVFQVPANASWAQNSWAPQPIERDGTIYLYFGNSGSGIGVASSTNPAGGFKDAKGSVLVDGQTPGASGANSWLFDPGALIDTDGTAYLSFGGNGETNARIIKLGSNLASVSGSAVQVTNSTGFFEASFMFKRGNNYYLAYSSDSNHGLRIDYLMSTSPMSGYKYAGTIADQPPINNNNNHASQFLFKDQWYHAYHNRVVATDAKISTTYKRNLAIEVMNFNDDGTIKKVTYTTDGVPQVGHLDPYVRVEAETFNAQSGIETETCKDGGMDVTEISDGDWIKVKGVDFGTAGAKSFSARVAATAAGGSIELRLTSATGTLIGTCSVAATGGAQTWGTTTCDVTGATGVNDLYFKFKGSGFGFDSWQFTGGDGPVGTGGAGGGGSSSAGASGSGVGGASPSGGVSNGGSSNGGSSAGGGAAPMGTGGRANAGGSNGGGSAGLVGAGGSSSTSGGASLGGNAATSGGRASGGAPATGSGGKAASGSGSTDSNSDSGCSCRVAGSGAGNHGSLALIALALLLPMRRLRLGRKAE